MIAAAVEVGHMLPAPLLVTHYVPGCRAIIRVSMTGTAATVGVLGCAVHVSVTQGGRGG